LFPPSRIRCRSRFRSKVRKNYVHPQEFRKNSVAYVKNNVLRFHKFAVAVNPFIGSSSIFPYLPFVRAWSSAHSLRGKLGALAPGTAALLPRTRPSSNSMYGHGF